MTDFTAIKTLYQITESNGYSKDEIEAIKEIYGKLPKVFIDYYSELGKFPSLNHAQDNLITPDQFHHYYNEEYLIFYCENQACCYWGIHKKDLDKSNPPVYMSYDKSEWKLEAKSLTDFFTAMAYLQASLSLNYSNETFQEIEESDLRYIRNEFTNRGVSFLEWTDGIEFFGNLDDTIMMVMGGGIHLIYASNNKEHFDEMDSLLSNLGSPM